MEGIAQFRDIRVGFFHLVADSSTCMVAFCAIFTLQSLDHASEWNMFRLATLYELVVELEKQSAQRHSQGGEERLSVVDAMARQLSRGIRGALARLRLCSHGQSSEAAMPEPRQAACSPSGAHNTGSWGAQWTADDAAAWDAFGVDLAAVPMFDFNQ